MGGSNYARLLSLGYTEEWANSNHTCHIDADDEEVLSCLTTYFDPSLNVKQKLFVALFLMIRPYKHVILQ